MWPVYKAQKQREYGSDVDTNIVDKHKQEPKFLCHQTAIVPDVIFAIL